MTWEFMAERAAHLKADQKKKRETRRVSILTSLYNMTPPNKLTSFPLGPTF
jgi:hypothetical protein